MFGLLFLKDHNGKLGVLVLLSKGWQGSFPKRDVSTNIRECGDHIKDSEGFCKCPFKVRLGLTNKPVRVV